ncbi:MAG: DUF3455 domain-containing protein [Acidobacteriota bacterium]|nr:DUF3455 domain-containing protein [Acidobacteriota bacterium]
MGTAFVFKTFPILLLSSLCAFAQGHPPSPVPQNVLPPTDQKLLRPALIPWQLLNATEHHGNGTMQNVLSIQRLNTEGGKPPANGCGNSHEGAQLRVFY